MSECVAPFLSMYLDTFRMLLFLLFFLSVFQESSSKMPNLFYIIAGKGMKVDDRQVFATTLPSAKKGGQCLYLVIGKIIGNVGFLEIEKGALKASFYHINIRIFLNIEQPYQTLKKTCDWFWAHLSMSNLFYTAILVTKSLKSSREARICFFFYADSFRVANISSKLLPNPNL